MHFIEIRTLFSICNHRILIYYYDIRIKIHTEIVMRFSKILCNFQYIFYCLNSN